MSIVTDSSVDGVPTHVYNIHKLIKSEDELKSLYEEYKGKYKALKDALVEDLDAFIAPMRERRAELAKDMNKIISILKQGNAQACDIANVRISEIKKLCGLGL